MKDLYTIKSQMLLYESILGNSEWQTLEEVLENQKMVASLPLELQAKITADYENLKTKLKKTFPEKIKEMLLLLAVYMPPLQQGWLFFAIVISISLLKRTEGAREAAWLLVVITLAYSIDNHLYTPDFKKPSSELFPSEELIVQKYLREPLGSKISEQQAQLKKGWQLYLIEEWAKEPVSKDEQIFHLQLKKAEFFFNLAQINELEQIDRLLSSSQNIPGRQPSSLLFLYILWNTAFAIIAFKYSNNSKPKTRQNTLLPQEV